MMTTTLSRSDFMKLTGTTVLAACAGGAVLGGCSAVSTAPLAPDDSYHREDDLVIVSLSAVIDLEPLGSAVRLEPRNGSQPGILLIHSGEHDYRAFANRCTHNGKELDYRHDKQRVQCISGKSHFSLDGNKIKGPAEAPLQVYPCQLDGGELIIHLS
jgi:nitrite reductase/ring-hydroxylating ferredoxin subunit